ncbi:MAG: hypothetical protein OEL84_07315 [Nitrosopumilus sp.]|nr:hypothetical protein [Nitrosopumilus sp.]
MVQTEDLKIFEYTAISPDNTARIILEKLSKILDTKQKEVMITSQTLDASFSDYLENLEQYWFLCHNTFKSFTSHLLVSQILCKLRHIEV